MQTGCAARKYTSVAPERGANIILLSSSSWFAYQPCQDGTLDSIDKVAMSLGSIPCDLKRVNHL